MNDIKNAEFPNILIIDDEKGIQDLMKVFINVNGYFCDTVESLKGAREMMDKKKYDIVFIDLILNDDSGMDFMKEILGKNPEILIVIISGIPENQTIIDSIQNGSFDYIEKPFNLDLLQTKLDLLIKEWKIRVSIKQYYNQFDKILNMYEEKHKYIDTNTSTSNSILDFVNHLKLPFPETKSHRERLAVLCELLGTTLELDEETVRVLKYGAYLHDIGVKLISDEILMKNDLLTREGFKKVKKHPVYRFSIIEKIEQLTKVSELILHHHEWYNGTGYPLELNGKNIPFYARIFTVVDAFDSMIVGRNYKKRMNYEKAIEEIKNFKAKQFDPDVVDAFLRIPYEKINLLYNKKPEEEVRYGFAVDFRN